MNCMYYISGPMTTRQLTGNESQKDFYIIRNEKIAKKLEKAGIKIYLPQRDTNQSLTPRKIFDTNIRAVKKSDGVIVLLSETRGIYLEAGYAKAMRKTILGLQVDETRALGTIVRNFFDTVVNNTDDLIILLKKLEKKNKKPSKR